VTWAVLIGSLTTYARQSYLVIGLLAVVLVVQAIMLLRKKYKKPLVFTNRVKRLYFTIIVLVLIAIEVAGYLASGTSKTHAAYVSAIVALIALAASPLLTVAGNWLLHPVEKAINNRYINDAKNRLAQMSDLTVIGITGSYGKTSTKHYLNRILSEHFSVLMTPGSYNTTMGVVRTVREMMQPYNQIFICEMGAKNIGDIKEICDIAHPSIGIVTAVGPQHLESFKTIANVQRTKFELVDALPADGLAVLNNDFADVANREVTNVAAQRYTVNKTAQADFWAEDVRYSARGTEFTIVSKQGKRLTLETKLVGECNISNLIAAVAVAWHLGVPDDKIRYAVSRIEQVEHRLNMKRGGNGITIIDDAYNSNPVGSRMALDVLKGMNTGKRIVITPGMIELGDEQQRLNTEFGEHIAECCDIAIIVGQYNREAIVTGIKNKGFDERNLHIVDTFDQGQQLMLTLAGAGDTVLYENDLPDAFK